MKKENLVSMVLGIVGGIPFALGMVMALMNEWNLLIPGIICGSIGLIILISILPIYRKMVGKTNKKLQTSTIISTLIGLVGTTGLAFALVNVLTNDNISETPLKSIIAIGVGLIGIVVCLVNYPINKVLVKKKEGIIL